MESKDAVCKLKCNNDNDNICHFFYGFMICQCFDQSDLKLNRLYDSMTRLVLTLIKVLLNKQD